MAKLETTIQVQVSAEMRENLEALAKADRRSLSGYCRVVLQEHLEKNGK